MKKYNGDIWGEMNLQCGDVGVKEVTSLAVGRNSSFAKHRIGKCGYNSRRYKPKVSPLLHIQPRACIRKRCPKVADATNWRLGRVRLSD